MFINFFNTKLLEDLQMLGCDSELYSKNYFWLSIVRHVLFCIAYFHIKTYKYQNDIGYFTIYMHVRKRGKTYKIQF